MNVDTRLLQYFIAVAEELNFTRASERLYISQPALSKQIRLLEKELQVLLFVRTKQDVRLTAAGHSLLAGARILVEDWSALQRDVRSVAANSSNIFRIGFEASGAGLIMTKARNLFAELHPGIKIEPKRFDWGGEVAALREGLVDVAFIWLPAEIEGIRTELITTESRMAGLCLTHRLTALSSISVLDLNQEPIMWTRRAPKIWVDWWAVNPRPDGSEPIWGPENDNVEEMLEQVASGNAICIVPASMAVYYARPDIVWLPIRDIEPLKIAIGSLESNWHSEWVSDFVRVVKQSTEENSRKYLFPQSGIS